MTTQLLCGKIISNYPENNYSAYASVCGPEIKCNQPFQPTMHAATGIISSDKIQEQSLFSGVTLQGKYLKIQGSLLETSNNQANPYHKYSNSILKVDNINPSSEINKLVINSGENNIFPNSPEIILEAPYIQKDGVHNKINSLTLKSTNMVINTDKLHCSGKIKLATYTEESGLKFKNLDMRSEQEVLTDKHITNGCSNCSGDATSSGGDCCTNCKLEYQICDKLVDYSNNCQMQIMSTTYQYSNGTSKPFNKNTPIELLKSGDYVTVNINIQSNCKPDVNLIGLSLDNNFFQSGTATLTDTSEALKTNMYKYEQRITYLPKKEPMRTHVPIIISFKVSITNALFYSVSGVLRIVGISANAFMDSPNKQAILKTVIAQASDSSHSTYNSDAVHLDTNNILRDAFSQVINQSSGSGTGTTNSSEQSVKGFIIPFRVTTYSSAESKAVSSSIIKEVANNFVRDELKTQSFYTVNKPYEYLCKADFDNGSMPKENVDYHRVKSTGCTSNGQTTQSCHYLERSLSVMGGITNPNTIQGSKILLTDNCSNSLEFLYNCPIVKNKTCYNSCGEAYDCAETITTDENSNELKCKSLINLNTEKLAITLGYKNEENEQAYDDARDAKEKIEYEDGGNEYDLAAAIDTLNKATEVVEKDHIYRPDINLNAKDCNIHGTGKTRIDSEGGITIGDLHYDTTILGNTLTIKANLQVDGTLGTSDPNKHYQGKTYTVKADKFQYCKGDGGPNNEFIVKSNSISLTSRGREDSQEKFHSITMATDSTDNLGIQSMKQVHISGKEGIEIHAQEGPIKINTGNNGQLIKIGASDTLPNIQTLASQYTNTAATYSLTTNGIDAEGIGIKLDTLKGSVNIAGSDGLNLGNTESITKIQGSNFETTNVEQNVNLFGKQRSIFGIGTSVTEINGDLIKFSGNTYTGNPQDHITYIQSDNSMDIKTALDSKSTITLEGDGGTIIGNKRSQILIKGSPDEDKGGSDHGVKIDGDLIIKGKLKFITGDGDHPDEFTPIKKIMTELIAPINSDVSLSFKLNDNKEKAYIIYKTLNPAKPQEKTDILYIDTVKDKPLLNYKGEMEAFGFTSVSDKNMKENIKLLENSLDKVSQMRGVSFDWKNTDDKSIGVIAQELQAISGCESLVNNNGDNLSVNYNGIIGFLIESIKELNNKIDNLTN